MGEENPPLLQAHSQVGKKSKKWNSKEEKQEYLQGLLPPLELTKLDRQKQVAELPQAAPA